MYAPFIDKNKNAAYTWVHKITSYHSVDLRYNYKPSEFLKIHLPLIWLNGG